MWRNAEQRGADRQEDAVNHRQETESQNQVISITDDRLCSGIQFTLEAAV